MTGYSTESHKDLKVFSGRAHTALAEQVADELGIELVPTTARDFANGEIFIRFEESVRGSDAFVLQAHPQPLNNWPVSYTHLTLPTTRLVCRSRWSPYH